MILKTRNIKKKSRCVFLGHTDTDCDTQAHDPYKYIQAVRAVCFSLTISSKCVLIHWARE